MSIDERVSVSQIQKAVKSLASYAANKKKETQESGKVLFDDEDENVWLVVTTKTMSPSLTLKPQRIPLAHPIVDPRVSSICLITKDPQRAYKDLLQKNSIAFISRVVGITKLKGKFSPYDARRQLAGDHGLFLADERIIPLLPSLLGKAFFKKKKQPIPVNLLKKDLKTELESAISSTYMHQNAGTSLAIKIGHTGMDNRKLLANVEKAIPAVARKLYSVNKRRKNGEKNKVIVKDSMKSEEERIQEREESWENIQSLGIKTHSSVCLPIWSCALSDRWIASTPIAASTTSNGKAISNGTSKPSKPIQTERENGDDDTMSEGEDSDEKRLSNKLAKSSLNTPKKPAKRSAEDTQSDGRKKKRKADDDDAEAPAIAAPLKKSKKSLPVPASKKSKDQSTASAEVPPSTEKAAEKSKKADRAKAADFMEEDTPPVSKENQKAKKKDVSASSSPFAAADASLKAHKEKKRDKVLAEAEAAGMMQDTTLPVIKSGVPTPAPFAAADASLKAHKKEKKREKASGESTAATKMNDAGSSSMQPPSKPVQTSTTVTPLKSALKKSGSSAPGSGLTPSELSEKKAKKATFSVVEKKKEKMVKGVITGTGKSGKGGKSKMSLLGRGPKM